MVVHHTVFILPGGAGGGSGEEEHALMREWVSVIKKHTPDLLGHM